MIVLRRLEGGTMIVLRRLEGGTMIEMTNQSGGAPDEGVLRVVSANVNGVRAAARRGMGPWLDRVAADVLCLQEIRADSEQFDDVLTDLGLTQWFRVHAQSVAKGRSGVAIVAAPQLTCSKSPDPPELAGFADRGRWVETQIRRSTEDPWLTVASVYAPTGQAQSPRQDEKYAFFDAVTARLQRAHETSESLIMAGDLNVGHTIDDIKNWRGNRGKAGFLDQERAYLDAWLAQGWVDVHRAAVGDGPGPYTWWSWRGQAFDNDAGWRIDYQWASQDLANRALGAWVGRAPSYDQRWSDHAAVVVDYGDPRGVTDR